MVTSKSVVGIIPARGGSKGVPKKNVTLIAGFPLIAYAIVACKLTKCIERVVVSTDSGEIAEISKRYGAEIPFMRPEELAGCQSTDIEFVRHALDWFQENEGHEPDYLVHMRPTTPLREPTVLDQAVRMLMAHPEATGLRSVHEITESPYKLFGVEGSYLKGLFPGDSRKEYYNLPRQVFPPVYQPNGYVDIIKRETVRHLDSLHGSLMLAFLTDNVGELDTPADIQFIEFNLSKRPNTIFDHLRAHYGQL